MEQIRFAPYGHTLSPPLLRPAVGRLAVVAFDLAGDGPASVLELPKIHTHINGGENEEHAGEFSQHTHLCFFPFYSTLLILLS
jgi:hypothetical protein